MERSSSSPGKLVTCTIRSYILSKSIVTGATFFLSAPALAVAVLSVVTSRSCQSCDDFSQSSFRSHTNQTSVLLDTPLLDRKPSFEPSGLQKGLTSARGCIETFTALPESFAA